MTNTEKKTVKKPRAQKQAKGQLVGYARVSSTGQTLEVQLGKLKEYSCVEIFKEKKSGTSRGKREQFRNAMKYLRKGDTLVITKLDRLARSTMDLLNIKYEVKEKGAELVILDQPLMNDSAGDLMYTILGAIAEFENQLRKERRRDGINAAQKNGVRFGAKSKLTDEQLEEMKADKRAGMLTREVMEKYSLSKASVYRLIKEPGAL